MDLTEIKSHVAEMEQKLPSVMTQLHHINGYLSGARFVLAEIEKIMSSDNPAMTALEEIPVIMKEFMEVCDGQTDDKDQG